MCGIIGFAGHTGAVPVLLDGLERLEYRGYDSAGVAVVSENGGLRVEKSKGRLSALRKRLDEMPPLTGCVGVGHTRWATHGEPSDVNAHPHLGESGRIAVVHNGIIENYLELKAFLERRGVRFRSETDTEVIAQLMDYYYAKSGNVMDAVCAALARIKGAYALGVLCSDNPKQIIAVRHDAPLIIGYGEGANYIASDVTALLPYTRAVSYMEDDEIAVVSAEHVQFLDAGRCPVHKETQTVDWDVAAAEKGGYAHFMLKEIMEQPEAVRKTIYPRLRNGEIVFDELSDHPQHISNVSRIYIVACGSSYHVGMVGKYALEKLLRLPVETCLASEFRYCDPLVDSATLVIIISQSGETSDSIAALREAKGRGAYVLSIVNVVGSSIARESDTVLYTWAGPEIAVATTKAYSTQLVLLMMLGVYFARQLKRMEDAAYIAFTDALCALPEKMRRVLADLDTVQRLASQYFNQDSVFYIGRYLDYALGLEGSLKLKERSYIHSESYAAGELKHGTISLMEPGVLVIALATYAPLINKTFSNIVEVRSRSAEVIALTTESGADRFSGEVSALITVPDTHPLLQPSLDVLPLQLFAYYVALNRGCDIDKPRNLAKSVTVE